jgi:hypothetical protein
MVHFRTPTPEPVELLIVWTIAMGDRRWPAGVLRNTGELPMKCFVCGNEMRLTLVEPHDEVARPGFEYRTFRCESCGDTERRFVFDPRVALDLAAVGSA